MYYLSLLKSITKAKRYYTYYRKNIVLIEVDRSLLNDFSIQDFHNPLKRIQIYSDVERLKQNHSLDLQISLHINYAKISCLFWLIKLNSDYFAGFCSETRLEKYT